MRMQNWLNARGAKLLEEINKTPFMDNSDEIKLQLIMTALRESSIEMFQRAAVNSRKEIEKINSQAMQDSIQEVEFMMASVSEPEKTDIEPVIKPEIKSGGIEKITTRAIKEEKPEPKIKLKSSVIRRVDSH